MSEDQTPEEQQGPSASKAKTSTESPCASTSAAILDTVSKPNSTKCVLSA